MEKKLITVQYRSLTTGEFDSYSSIFSYEKEESDFNIVHKLFYSRLGDWTSAFKGKLAAEATDTGNGVVIKISDIEFSLGYSQIQVLAILLSQVEKESRHERVAQEWVESK